MQSASESIPPPRFQILQCPAILVALFLSLGISLCSLIACIPRVWLSIAGFLLIITVLTRRRQLVSTLSLSLAIFLIGLTAAQIERFEFPINHIAAFTTDGDRFAEVELLIEQTPRLLLPSPGEQRALPSKQIAQAVLRQIRAKSGWTAASGRVLLTLDQPNARLGAGQIVRATGILERPASPTNPGEFDSAAFYRAQRIVAAFRIAHSDGIEILQDNGPGPIEWLREKTRHLLAEGFTADHDLDHALLRALVLGDPDPQLRDVQDEFIHTGMVHQLSISGLHVAIIGGIVLMICRLLRISPRKSVVFSMLVITLYATVALPSWPGWRSVIMCGAASIGLLSRRWINGLQLLCIAVAIILLIHPADLGNSGFQISLAAVLGLMLFSRRLKLGLLGGWRGADPMSPLPRQRGAFVSGALWIGRFIFASMIAGMSAWIASMPLVAYRYGQLNAWSVPGSIAMLPLTCIALLGGVLKILLTLCWPDAAGAWAMAATWPVALMRGAVGAMNHLPGASIPMAAPSIAMLCIFYGLLAIGLLRLQRPVLRRLLRAAPLAACIGFVILSIPIVSPIANPISQSQSRRQVRISLVSLGAGQCGVVTTASNHAVLIDDGSSTVTDVARRLITPFLASQEINGLDKILLSHGDFDHIGGTLDLCRTYHQPQVFMSPHFERHAIGNFVAEGLLQSLRAANHPPAIIHRGDHLDLGNGLAIDVLWPPVNCDMNSNDCGLVLKLSFAGRTVLFPADIQDLPERELLKNPRQLEADVLVAPHHGSAELTTRAFVAAVHPRFILASNANRLTHKQKAFDLLETNYPLYRTSREGAITLTIDDRGKITVATFLNVPPQGAGNPMEAAASYR
jgi:competence protein ComEC